MKIKNSLEISLTILFLILSASVAQAFSAGAIRQEEAPGAPGTEKPVFKQTDKNTGNSCYVYKDYVVMTITSADVGEDIKVFKRGGATDFKKACANPNRAAYMTYPNTDANYFFGLTGDKFLVDSGTSAGDRGLDVVSLTSKKVIYTTSYNENVKVVGNTIIYNKPSTTKGSLKSCPNAPKWKKQGGGVGWVIPTKIDLTTLKETKAGQLTCVYVE
jgi:hypothetical protein